MYERQETETTVSGPFDNLRRVSADNLTRRDHTLKSTRKDASMSTSKCHNGVCSLDWKPKRPG